jgi:hypothetical protein
MRTGGRSRGGEGASSLASSLQPFITKVSEWRSDTVTLSMYTLTRPEAVTIAGEPYQPDNPAR